MAGALLQFMKTDNPNGAGLPEWPKYSAANGETMVFDDACEAKNDPDREARKALPIHVETIIERITPLDEEDAGRVSKKACRDVE